MAAEAPARLRSVRDWLRFTVARFNEAGLHFGHGSTNAHDEAAYLILHTLKLPLDELDPVLDRLLTTAEIESIEDIVRRRVDERVPAAYLTREAWLGEFRFYVDERAIVPRSYIAELLRDELVPWVSDDQPIDKALDLCTGSGCLAILLALAFPDAEVDATELSPEALQVAARNVSDYGLQDRVHLVRGDLFAGLTGRYDVIVSNPPYVNRASMEGLPQEYRAEPQMALAGGEDGLEIVRRLLAQAGAHLNERGVLIVEIGHNRDTLERAFPTLPFTWLETSGGAGFVFLLTAAELRR
ncbi:MAG: 50S ribosomal protein L3 N(5)-glutamine methyltransferase [Betaproteobacteria bacterium]|nr:50S ribosomal protein L3 N(5)-glutamine methyltransferase [Betaproteobacteria bacterium]